MDGAQVVGWLGAVGAIGAFTAAAIQIGMARADARLARAAELRGVALATDVITRPISADAGSGRSRWVYEFTVHNPGRLPVSSVDVLVAFSMAAERVHFDGSVTPLPSGLDMHVPVVPANGTKSWTRTVLIEHARHAELRSTKSTVTFTSPDGGRLRTVWPAGGAAESANPRLRRAVADIAVAE